MHKSFTNIIKGLNMGTVKTHIPFESCTNEIVLEIVNQQLMIICMSRHLPHVHDKVDVRTRISLVFLNFRHLKLCRNLHIRYETQVLRILPKQLFPSQSLHLFLELLKLVSELNHPFVNTNTITWIIMENMFFDMWNSMDQKRSSNYYIFNGRRNLIRSVIFFRYEILGHGPRIDIRHLIMRSADRRKIHKSR